VSEVDRWDHGGFDQLQFEQQDKYSKFAKNRKNHPDNTMAADSMDTSSRGRGPNPDKAKWAHDKYQETVDDFPPLKIKEECDVKEAPQETKTKRKPDRQLYSVRQKCSTKNEDVKKTKETTIQCSERLNCSAIEKKEDAASPYLKTVKEVLKAFDEKEVHSTEEDKLSISNVSTAMSDRLRNWEEESYLKHELLKDRVDSYEMVPSPKHKEPLEVLFDILLETENGTRTVRIYQGEENYEALLEKLCSSSNFDARTGLYFKINVLQMIIEAGASNEKVNTAFEQLLDINYKILMCEGGYCEADESIAQYLEKEVKENEPILKNLEDSY